MTPESTHDVQDETSPVIEPAGPPEGSPELRRVRRWPVRIGASFVAVAGLGLGAGVVVIAPHAAPWGAVPAEVLEAAVLREEVAPATTTLSCPAPVPVNAVDGEVEPGVNAASDVIGSLTLVELTAGAQDAVIPLGEASDPLPAPLRVIEGGADALGVTTLAAEGALGVLGSAATTTPDATATAADRAASVTEPAEPGGAVAFAARGGDLRGLSATECSRTATDQWILAGETTPGHTATLMLDNPGRTIVTVQLELYSAAGALEPTTAYVVPPGAHQEILLAGVAAGERRLALHLTTRGGPIGAAVAVSRLDGLIPRGVDLATYGAGPQTLQVIAGVALERSEIDDEDAPTLRLLAPQAATNAHVWLLGEDGRVALPGAENVALRRGEVIDISLAGVPAGNYAIVVDGSAPILAAARVLRTGSDIVTSEGDVQVTVGTSTDLAWIRSSVLVAAPGADEARSDLPRATGDLAAAPPSATQPPSALAIPAGTDATIVLTALPRQLSTHLDVLEDIPVHYGDGTDDADAAAPLVRGILRAYDEAGAEVAAMPVSARLGATVTIPLGTIAPGAEVTALVLTHDEAVADPAVDGVDLVWAATLAQPDVPGGIAVIAPHYPSSDTRTIVVSPTDDIGR